LFIFPGGDKPLGSGTFGVVVKGRMKTEEVAVKTTRMCVDKVYLKALLQELKVLAYLGSHENIVNMCGAHTTKLRQGNVSLFRLKNLIQMIAKASFL